MTEAKIRRLLEQVAAGRLSAAHALRRLRYLPFEDLGFARIDNHRTLRRDIPEVVFGAGKSVEQIVKIGQRMNAAGINLMVTRLDPAKARAVKRRLRKFDYRPEAHIGLLLRDKPVPHGHGAIMVATAGTSDIPVAEEAAVSAEFFGNRVERLYDVGVAGLHRLTSQLKALEAASVIIVVAGMEGALPSVVAGLVSKPVIGVPTSVGYGAAFGGITPLLGMLNSCAGGLTVVNIDNGFGAALAATLINRMGGSSGAGRSSDKVEPAKQGRDSVVASRAISEGRSRQTSPRGAQTNRPVKKHGSHARGNDGEDAAAWSARR
ncbi:MAG: nickel pincer cofactor biosynthesis protein LarB [Deltaproteobacteria bacterium]|nr:nickel pincer cofactor biosynthesis protein LarB [Deltaproteobacteria bacterium]MBV8454688.1 nickel pincer cofactor biosynthesis protein LarB [Deltaproteobacteria bacterium]